MSTRIPMTGNEGLTQAPKDRRIRKSQQAIQDAFISLTLESGYHAVTVEDIADRADVARATFYAHYEDKEQLLTALFQELTTELALRLTNLGGAPPQNMRSDIVRELYAHAAQFRDLYLVCLRGAGDGQARSAYRDVIAARAEALFAERLQTSNREPKVPLHAMGRAFAGAHVALLEDWLEAGDLSSIDEVVRTQMELLTRGFAWAFGMLPDEVNSAFPSV